MTDWELVKLNASKCRGSNTEWTSFIQHKRYKILEVYEKKIIIQKVVKGKPVLLSEKLVNKAAEKLKKVQVIRKSELLKNSVARETAFVYLHPFVSWDKQSKEVFWNDNDSELRTPISDSIREASDDDLEKILVAINKRKSQGKFRANILDAYENKCCVTSSQVVEILEAAHISYHSKSGINQSTNGLLFRVDIHHLFDSNLLLIHPTELIVVVNPTLSRTEYFKYNKLKINQRKDNKLPNEVFLKEKWNNSDWTEKIQ